MEPIPSPNQPRPLNLNVIESATLDICFKGLPQIAMGTPLGSIGSLELNILDEDFILPVAVLKNTALEHNSSWMRRFLEMTGTVIAPHGKTSMAPQLFDRQLRDGAWGLTAATVSQLRVYRRHGVKRVLYANQLTGAVEIDYVLDELRGDPDFDFYCLVDSEEGLNRLLERLKNRPIGRPLQVLLEVGVSNGRTGVRSHAHGLRLGRAIHAAGPEISLRGIETFEGVFSGYQHAQLEVAVADMLSMVSAIACSGVEEKWFGEGPIILTAGGSAFFDLAANLLSTVELGQSAVVVLRSGCYLTHDSHHYGIFAERMRQRMPQVKELGAGLRPALEIVAYIQSVPEPNRAIASFGKRDASFDIDLPQPLWWYRPGTHDKPQPIQNEAKVAGLNDQHAYLSLSENHPFRVGDIVGFGISHPCTTFDKWPLLLVADDAYGVVSAVRTFF